MLLLVLDAMKINDRDRELFEGVGVVAAAKK
jgi:hypothetical protein